MHRLLAIGFACVGHWRLKDGRPVCELLTKANATNVLYAFVSDGEVRYVGKTTQTLKKRLYGYQNPGRQQRTNLKNHRRILALLQQGRTVDVFALVDSGLLTYGDFHLNLAAGLEDSIIAILEPDWNGRGQGEGASADPQLNPTSDAPPSGGQAQVNRFPLTLQPTYWRQGFFNITKAHDGWFGRDGESIEIFLGPSDAPVIGYINRTANNNGSPRIMGGSAVRDWLQEHFEVKAVVQVSVLSPTAIRLGL